MSLRESIGRQCRKPEGTFGRMVARKMNRSHDDVTKWGLQFLEAGSGARLLDIGCGGGKNIENLATIAPHGKVIGLDHSRDMVTLSRQINLHLLQDERVGVVQASVSNLPFKAASFDAITAVETHFFWPDLVNDLREVRRVLRPGGMILLISEAYSHPDFEERNREWEIMSDFKIAAPDETKKSLEEAGLVEVELATCEERNWLAAWGRSPRL